MPWNTEKSMLSPNSLGADLSCSDLEYMIQQYIYQAGHAILTSLPSFHRVPIPRMPSRTTIDTPNGKIPIVKPLSAFTRLSPSVGFYEPPKSLVRSGLTDDSSPTIILLCSWMNAKPKNVDYYTRNYMSLYPTARIIHVTINTTQFIFQSEAQRRKDMMIAVSTLLARDEKSERIFVHCISNGGGKRGYNIAGAYRSVTGKALPAQAMIFDSGPGLPRFKRDVYSLMVPTQKMNWLPWLFYATVSVATCSMMFVSVYWTPLWFWYDLVWGPTYGCSDTTLVDEISMRGYIYSKEDLAIDWRDVEAHAAAAEEKGYKVSKKLIHGAHHAQLFKGKDGEEDYWGFVKEIWAKGTRATE
ncbi:uncharacterized protein LY89DRAFT_679768 [Mollisia scopiformis]|uniref:Uncharacterized protein n=1 Tax=Mollisia scopiformis TaxID=149040 RepID=A0A194XRW9_MOLSC|nr:uncharacterized protein LY89DRAFT_679768 [Mollisia scopiformis]KUJ22938.1 hypothetical protein LY89DRAFT_679768 [Mollisia scopiformis]